MEYKTNKDFYMSLDEFGRINYITNFIRFKAPEGWDLEVPLYQRKIKEMFQAYLDLPYISDEIIECLVTPDVVNN